MLTQIRLCYVALTISEKYFFKCNFFFVLYRFFKMMKCKQIIKTGDATIYHKLNTHHNVNARLKCAIVARGTSAS